MTNSASERTISLSTGQIHERTIIEGSNDNPHLVFMNGIPVSASIYDDVIKHISISDSRRIVAIDLPGTGLSHMKRKTYTWENQRACLQEYFESHQTSEKIIPVVHDIAGPVFLPLLSKLKNIHSYVVMNTILKPSVFRPIFPMSAMKLKGLGAIVALTTPLALFNPLIRKEGFDLQQKVSDDWLKKIFGEMSANGGKMRLYRTLQAFELTPETDKKILDALNLDIPRLVIWGNQDRSLGAQLQYLPKETSSNQKLETIESAKHFFMMDHAEEVASLIQKFISV